MVDERGSSNGWWLLRGPVQLVIDGREADLGPPRQRCVLAVLLLAAGRGVPTATLVERVWGERPPRARNPVAPYAARLRRVLDNRLGTLSFQAGGYRLSADPALVDVHRARRLATDGRAAARAGDDERAVALLGAALAGWQADPLADLPGEWAAATREALRRERADLLADWAEAGLRRGRPAELIDTLRPAVADDPVAERLAAALMAAFAATGQVAAALDCYAGLRAAVAERFGAEPSAVVRDLHVRLLRDRPSPGPPPVVPAQLPLAVRGFTGRAAELARLDALLDADGATVAVVHGSPGVGKTTLAVHWGHRAAGRFPDGQLFADLRAVRPGQAVRGFLRALGVPADGVPPDRDAQTALYRSLLAGKRVLIVLDDARDADQVRPLLPGVGAATVLVTSRNQLAGLVAAEGAQPVPLDVLPAAQGRRMLAGRLGADRIGAEPQAVRQIVTACAGLPLALAITAARAHLTGFPLATIAAELADADQRIDALDAGAVFAWSYTALTPAAARLFRLLSLHPGPHLGVAAAASLSGEPAPATRRWLAELARCSLLVEHPGGRYSMHDLLRAYAAQLSRRHDDADRRRAALTRLLDHYVHTAYAADRRLDPNRAPMPRPLDPPAPGVTLDPPADRDRARLWLTAEIEVLAAVQRSAATFPGHVWQLAWSLDTFLSRLGHWHDLAASWRLALTAAERLPDPRCRAYADNLFAYVSVRLDEHRRAERHFARALRLYRQLGDHRGQAHTHRNLGLLRWRQGDRAGALHHAEQALAGFRAAGLAKGTADALNAVGWCHVELGNPAAALEHCGEALTIHRRMRDPQGEAATWDSLGCAHHQLGDHARAEHCFGRSVALYAELGDRWNEADALTHLGDSHRAAGDPAAARAAWRRAHDLLTGLGHPDADAVLTRIMSLA